MRLIDGHAADTPWERYHMALDEVKQRLQRICRALSELGVPYALVGGQAVALWVATRDPDAVRTTKDVDILLRRADLPQARAAARQVDLDYFEAIGVGMFLERETPNPRRAVHLIWAGEKVRPEYEWAAPGIDEAEQTVEGFRVVSLKGLVAMKLQSFRDQDRVHLRDLIDIDLVDRTLVGQLPRPLSGRLDALLTEMGR